MNNWQRVGKQRTEIKEQVATIKEASDRLIKAGYIIEHRGLRCRVMDNGFKVSGWLDHLGLRRISRGPMVNPMRIAFANARR